MVIIVGTAQTSSTFSGSEMAVAAILDFIIISHLEVTSLNTSPMPFPLRLWWWAVERFKSYSTLSKRHTLNFTSRASPSSYLIKYGGSRLEGSTIIALFSFKRLAIVAGRHHLRFRQTAINGSNAILLFRFTSWVGSLGFDQNFIWYKTVEWYVTCHWCSSNMMKIG
jgi:hypothetical protein